MFIFISFIVVLLSELWFLGASFLSSIIQLNFVILDFFTLICFDLCMILLNMLISLNIWLVYVFQLSALHYLCWVVLHYCCHLLILWRFHMLTSFVYIRIINSCLRKSHCEMSLVYRLNRPSNTIILHTCYLFWGRFTERQSLTRVAITLLFDFYITRPAHEENWLHTNSMKLHPKTNWW